MENKTGKYFKYAIGEIVLVVIGILIALSINNWNQVRIQNNEILKIHQRIIIDVDNDIRELNSRLRFWRDKEPVFKKVVNDSISAELLDEGLSRLLTSRPRTNLNTTGVQQLKSLNVKDELSLKIIETYDYMEHITLIPNEKKINDESEALISLFQDKYEWFQEWMTKTIMKDNSSEELRNYFLKSMEYRNRVINGHWRIYNNYIPSLEFNIRELQGIRNELKIISDSDFKVMSKKDLEPYVGSFKITKIENNNIGIEVDEIYQITAHDNFLRLINLSQPFFTDDYFYINENSFYSLLDQGKLKFDFEEANSQKMNSFKMIIEINNEKGIYYASKQNE